MELALAIAFGVCGRQRRYNAGAVLEWVIAFIYFFYVLSFFIDFLPAAGKKGGGRSRAAGMEVAEAGFGDGAHDGGQYFRGAPNGAAAAEGYPDRYGNGNGYTNGHHKNKKPDYPPPNHF